MFKSPFARGFWGQSARALGDLRILIFCAMCMAASIVLGYFYIPITDGLTIRFSYLATATAGLAVGPVGALIYGMAVDLLDFMMHPTGAFFFGYTLNAMIGAFFYGLFLYRQRVTVFKIVLCRLCVNYIVNVLLGAYWSSVLYSRGYLYYLTSSLIKNTVMLPIEVIIMTAFFSLLLPAMKGARMIPAEQNRRITWF